jgi:ribonuclease HI
MKKATATKAARNETSETIHIFTDGACSGNPGPGGWAAIIRTTAGDREMCGGERETTNNRMELTAVIEALGNLEGRCGAIVTTDSMYLKKGITIWIHNWKSNGWRTADKKPVKNQELWVELDELRNRHDVEWCWVRGHNGHRENERCDELAKLAIANLMN